MAQLRLGSGDLDRAEKLLNRALDLFPDYNYALANLGKVRMGQERFAEAVELFETPTVRKNSTTCAVTPTSGPTSRATRTTKP